MTVKELIKTLKTIKDQNLPIRVIDHIVEDNMPNKWIISIGSIHNTGDSGYEISGEVVLLTSE
tara:strand:- start:511 stop:699 length:189 start_codon:yes stop_codon:yes gene_type:complete